MANIRKGVRTYKKQSLAKIIDDSLPEPIFELTDEKIEKLKNYKELAMAVLSIATILTMTVVAPNAIQALKIFERKKGRRISQKNLKQKTLSTFYSLRRRGYIQFERKGDDYEVRVTDKGRQQIKRLNFNTLRINHPQSWDGKFWQIAVDIPLKYKKNADELREKLKSLGCYALQRSLWFYPHDPRGEVEFVARNYLVANYVTFMKIDRLDPEDERVLKDYFKSELVI